LEVRPSRTLGASAPVGRLGAGRCAGQRRSASARPGIGCGECAMDVRRWDGCGAQAVRGALRVERDAHGGRGRARGNSTDRWRSVWQPQRVALGAVRPDLLGGPTRTPRPRAGRPELACGQAGLASAPASTVGSKPPAEVPASQQCRLLPQLRRGDLGVQGFEAPSPHLVSLWAPASPICRPNRRGGIRPWGTPAGALAPSVRDGRRQAFARPDGLLGARRTNAPTRTPLLCWANTSRRG
jgi:hypothetical protein